MYKVFLADDEIVVREGIRSNFPWEKTDFVLAGEAPDGEMALSMLQDIKPDILITDIRMPFMDGLALCRAVSASMPWISIVILSGYDDFAYAREAISLGVKEYLLKPVSGEELLQVLNRLAERIREEKRQQQSLRTFRDQLASSGALLREKLLSDLLLGVETGGVLERARALQMNLVARVYLVMLADPATEDASAEDLTVMQSVLGRLCDSSGGAAHLCQIRGRSALLVLGDETRDLEERTYALAQAIQYDVEQNTGLKPFVAIGPMVDALDKTPDSCAGAHALMTKQLSEQTRRIIDARDEAEAEAAAAALPLLELKTPPIYEQLKLAGRAEASGILAGYFDSLGDSAAQSRLIANYVYVDILLSATRIVKECGGDPQSVIPRKYQDVSGQITAEQLEPMAKELLDIALCYRDERGSSRYGALIRKA